MAPALLRRRKETECDTVSDQHRYQLHPDDVSAVRSFCMYDASDPGVLL